MKDDFSVAEVVTAISDLFLPRTCLVCGRQLGTREQHLCIYCSADIPFTRYWNRERNPMSDRFNAKIQQTLEEPGARYARNERYAYASALFFYNGDADYKKIPQALKYNYDIHAGEFFADCLGHHLAGSRHFSDVDTVIPVPLHWLRRWERGYNQAEVIGARLASALGARLRTDILFRARITRTQTRLSVAEKARNVASAFKVNTQNLKGIIRHILLVDDVFTTGATLHACFRALRDALPSDIRISIATLAVVDM